MKIVLLSAFAFISCLGFAKEARQISKELGSKDILAVETATSLKDATVIMPEDKAFSKAAQEALDMLEGKYGFSLKKISDTASRIPAGNYILFSNGLNGALTTRLLANDLIIRNKYGYEVRNIPNAVGRNCNVMYFGGKKPGDLITGMKRFLKKVDAATLVTKYIDLECWNRRDAVNAEYKKAKLAEIKKLYSSEESEKNTKAIRLLSNVAKEYYNTGDEKIADTFMAMVKVFGNEYQNAKNWRKTPPSFRFQELVMAVDLVEEAETLTDDDRLFCANILRTVTEDCMNYWEMRDPMKLYDSGEVAYLTNHPLFASRGVNAAAKYLQARYDIPAAKYWDAVSAHVFKGVNMANIGPEDAGCYQWICRRIFSEFCMKSGEMEYKTPNLNYYIDYALANITQMGVVAPYGDTPPMIDVHGWSFLKIGKQVNNDKLCEYMLQRITINPVVKKAIDEMDLDAKVAYQPRLLGLTTFESDDFLKKFFSLPNQKAILNKAVFRNGYTPESEYLMLGGSNTRNAHGHMDANAIIQYSRGDRYWLLDGDYIKAFPREHNSIVVSRDTVLPDQRRSSPHRRDDSAEIDFQASSPDSRQAIMVSSLRSYGGMDWTRNIFWTSGKGFWIIDNLQALTSGRYVTKCFWRTLGQVKLNNGTFEVIQKKSENSKIPSRFYIARGDSANSIVDENLDLGHGAPFGYYDSYKYASPVVKTIVERNDVYLKKEEQIDYVNFFLASDEKNIPQVFKVKKQKAWIVKCDSPQLACLGNFTANNCEFIAERVLMDKDNLCAVNAEKIKIGNIEYKFKEKQNVYIEFGKGKFKQLSSGMAGNLLNDILTDSVKISKLNKPAEINVPEFKAADIISLPAEVTALAAADIILCGYKNGRLEAFSYQGKKLWENQLPAGIKALCPVKSGKEIFWAAGTDYENRKNPKAFVCFIDNKGKILWQRPVNPYHGRNGTIRTLCAARLKPGDKEQIVAGSEAWKYLAFDQKGKNLWTFPVLHAATVSAAGDMDGDGIDEIAVGTEYPYHWIINAKGKKLKAVLSSPGDCSVAIADCFTGKGKKAVAWGREDGYVKVMRPDKIEKTYMYDINVGGMPNAIIDIPGKGIAVATSNNAVVFIDGKGRKSKVLYFPSDMLNIVRSGDKFYSVSRDGYIYEFTENGIIGKCRLNSGTIRKQDSFLVSVKDQVVGSCKDKLLIFNRQ